MKHEGPHDGPKHHDHHLGMWQSWSSWQSPVGLGVFFLTTALAAAIALYALLNLIGAVVSVMRPAPSYSYPSDTSGMQMPVDTGAATGAGAAMPQ